MCVQINILRCLCRQDLENCFYFLYPILCNNKVDDTPPKALAEPAPVAIAAPAEDVSGLVSQSMEDDFLDMLGEL